MMLKKLSQKALLMPGAFDAVNTLRSQMPVALVSASPRNLMDAALTTLPEGFFAFTVSADDVARTKPFPDPYLLAAKKIGVDPADCVVFEDSLTGIESARAAGCNVIAVPHYVEVAHEHRVTVLDSLEELTIEMVSDFYCRTH
jgi:HAD superfamily hydrolase (TIGR01509 family)